MSQEEDPKYLQRELITCIGNKRGLLPFINEGVTLVKERLGKEKLIFVDLFSGSGVVSRFMKAHAERIIANDLELYANVVNACYLTNRSDVDWEQLRYYSDWLKRAIANDWRRGFIAELYAPLDDSNIAPGERVFYTRRNAEYIDTARQHISNIPVHLQHFFLASLIVKASIHNNTGGVFKGFYKNRQGLGAFGGEGSHALTRILGEIQIDLPVLSQFECHVHVTQEDAVQFGDHWLDSFDLVYIDPPYNQHPYGSNYFMLNLIATYERPVSYSNVSGIPNNWTRSPFNKPQLAKQALLSIISKIKTKYFLISYNSEGFVQKDEFIADLRKFGVLTILESQYNTYRASRNLVQRNQYVTEYLFLLETNPTHLNPNYP
ncbi:DNA adenine methylase [Candidatus Viridilinea mediisalina]|uniref:site-specific DNA-methyltransferase (adenine-specific) n=1 Tax=Candidatus Viridilinea mediisalina TaxID=2024553 RepID=A0A2A6RMW2_9CHLR|nr:DNA adenine methylase [Candidatus Viridilinea mediisalina]PDW04256.1 DNA modification methylase [Candidatus Viridilinea mediisalina]